MDKSEMVWVPSKRVPILLGETWLCTNDNKILMMMMAVDR